MVTQSNPTAREIVLQEKWQDLPFAAASDAPRQPDQRDGAIYQLTPALRTAIKVALVTFRPLLLRGDPGTGKSSLSAYLARNLGWRYYEHVVTARTEARDLIYSFDAVRRLADSQLGSLPATLRHSGLGSGVEPHAFSRPIDPADYIQPGVLWWALNRDSAARRGIPGGEEVCRDPNEKVNRGRSLGHAVVLIDEIDKADPDVPNNLLVALGSNLFHVAETGLDVTAAAPPPGEPRFSNLLVVITTNEERDLPRAFLRRCVVHELRLPEQEHDFVEYLKSVAALHRRRDGIQESTTETERAEAVARLLFRFRGEAADQNLRLPGTAEFLDAIRACRELGINPISGDPAWELIRRVTLIKPL